jgi:hypothetical protein
VRLVVVRDPEDKFEDTNLAAIPGER